MCYYIFLVMVKTPDEFKPNITKSMVHELLEKLVAGTCVAWVG
jgi:hypothetical protein